MRRSIRARLLIRKNRWRSRSGKVCHDCLKATALITVILVMSAMLIYGYNCAISSPYFRIRGTTVRGLRELTEKDIQKLVAIRPSNTVFSINIKAIARRISSNPWVRKVSIARELPDRLVLDIEERTAFALFKIEEDLYILDKEGVVFKKLDYGDDVDVPVLTGYYREGKVDKPLLDKTLDLLKKLASSKSFPTINMVSEINGSDVGGLSLFTDNGFCLKLGFDNYEGKLQRLLPVLTALNKKGIKKESLSIDLRNVSKIYVERRGIAEPAGLRGKKKEFST